MDCLYMKNTFVFLKTLIIGVFKGSQAFCLGVFFSISNEKKAGRPNSLLFFIEHLGKLLRISCRLPHNAGNGHEYAFCIRFRMLHKCLRIVAQVWK